MSDVDRAALDAYSNAVIGVAEAVLPSVASLRVRHRRGEGAGSASVLTENGHLLTSAHVVEGVQQADAAFADGTETSVDVVGRDLSPTWPCCERRTRFPRRSGWATPAGCGSASSWSRSAIRSDWPAA